MTLTDDFHQLQVQHSDTTATLCMPGYPPRHVCAADRRFLLTNFTYGRAGVRSQLSVTLLSGGCKTHLVHSSGCACVSLPMNAKLQTQTIQVIKHAPRFLTTLPQPRSLLLALCFCSSRNAPCMFLVLLICFSMPRPSFSLLRSHDGCTSIILSCIVLLPSTSTHHQSCRFPLERESSEVDLT